MSKFYKVKSHRLEQEKLVTIWDFFDESDSAIVFASALPQDFIIKVYTDTNELVYSIDPVDPQTYA